MPNDPNPLDPLTRYREIEKAAAALLETLDMIFHDPEYLEVFSCAQNHRGPYKGDDVVEEMAALRPILESTPDPNIALVPVRRIRTEEGEACCNGQSPCENWCPFETQSGGDCTETRNTCSFDPNKEIELFYDPKIKGRLVPHPDCPVWREEK